MLLISPFDYMKNKNNQIKKKFPTFIAHSYLIIIMKEKRIYINFMNFEFEKRSIYVNVSKSSLLYNLMV